MTNFKWKKQDALTLIWYPIIILTDLIRWDAGINKNIKGMKCTIWKIIKNATLATVQCCVKISVVQGLAVVYCQKEN